MSRGRREQRRDNHMSGLAQHVMSLQLFCASRFRRRCQQLRAVTAAAAFPDKLNKKPVPAAFSYLTSPAVFGTTLSSTSSISRTAQSQSTIRSSHTILQSLSIGESRSTFTCFPLLHPRHLLNIFCCLLVHSAIFDTPLRIFVFHQAHLTAVQNISNLRHYG